MSDDATLRARSSIRGALILVAVQLIGTMLLTIANKQGLIDDDTTIRGVMVLIGVMLVVSGNTMPKKLEGPQPTTLEHLVIRQDITRVGGWAMTLGGLIWIGLWAFAPRNLATTGSIASVGTAAIVMVAYAIWRSRAVRRPAP